MLEDVSRSVSKGGSEESQKQVAAEDTRTPAQIAYDKIQEKRVCTDVYIYTGLPELCSDAKSLNSALSA